MSVRTAPFAPASQTINDSVHLARAVHTNAIFIPVCE